MKSEEAIEKRVIRLKERSSEYNVGAGEVPPEIQAEINALEWVLED